VAFRATRSTVTKTDHRPQRTAEVSGGAPSTGTRSFIALRGVVTVVVPTCGLPGSIAEKTWVDINGVKQGMVIRGKNPANPVLLWVHGGPGMPDYFLTKQHPTNVDDLFTVAWWDQRGAGLSYHHHISPATMTIEQFISDILAVTDYLRQRFHHDKIYLLGHSWGSFIAIQAAARSPRRYHAYLGMAQMVYQLKSEKMAYDYMLSTYRTRGDTSMVRDLENAPVTMTTGTPHAYLKLRDKAMHELGVGTTHDMRSVITGIFLSSLRFPGYTLREKVNLWRGRAFSRSFGLWEAMIRVDLRTAVPRLDIPVFFFEGEYDYTCVTELARDYFRSLEAPVKGFYTFRESAHSPLLEEPAEAQRILHADVLAGTNALADLR
jgi:pimeloyl-ACP methyl ester carboxylesterase